MSDDSPSPVLTAALTALRNGFNQRFTNRYKTSDGWIGDEDHQDSTSGHNPDDTPGVSAEYSDSDTKPEVRAIDVDKDLNDSLYTMQDVIDTILITPNDLMRLKYIIFDRTIWSASNGWRPSEYTGMNPHTEHAHFSGDPLYDENDDPWSVVTLGEDMTDGQAYKQHVMNYRIDGLVHLREIIEIPPFTAPGGTKYDGFSETCQLSQWLRDVLEIVKTLQGAEGGEAGASAEQIAEATVDEFKDRLAE